MPKPKKSASTEVATTAAPEKKTTTKKAAKAETSVYLQMGSSEWDISAVKEKVVENITAAGHKASEIETLKVYLKPEEGKIYYAANETITGSIDM